MTFKERAASVSATPGCGLSSDSQKVSGVPAFVSRTTFRSPVWFAAAIVSVTLIPIALWGWLAFETRANALAVALADQRRVTEALGEHALKLLEAQAFALDLLAREAGERDCPALRADPRMESFMHRAAQSPQTRQLWILNADGLICMTSDLSRMDARSRSFRGYFIGARDAAPDRFFVDRAINGLVDSLPAFDVAKARMKSGAFNGIVLASVSLTELVQYWRTTIGTLPTQRIGLFRDDGATIARSWQPIVPAPDSATERRLAAIWQTVPDGNEMHRAAIDGRPSLSAWHRLPDWGVVVTSSIDRETILAPWRWSMLTDGVVTMMLSGLLATLTWSLLRAQLVVGALHKSESEFADMNRTLEERVRTEVAAREAAQGDAAHAHRMQALGQLAGGIAHDFNNILQAVQGSAGLIDKRATDPASVKRFAGIVVAAADRGAAITRRLLTFARRGDLRAERIDPAGLLDALRDVLAHTLGSPITVRVEGASGLPAVMADRGQLETVLVNLATNARDAMPDGGMLTLTAAAEEVLVHPAGLKPGQYVRLTVTDTGTGMDRTILERALEPFFTTKPQDKGTGLGLSMAKGFAEQSGGALAIESAPQRGTTVMLWLPVADALTQTAPVRPALAPVAGLARRVLVVDDDDTVRETLAAQLEDLNLEVLVASSGAEAIALLAQQPVDALVTDLSMPDMNGVTTIEKARALYPDLPCFLLTGYAGERAALAAGDAFTLVRKPVSAERLVAKIEAVIEARQRQPV